MPSAGQGQPYIYDKSIVLPKDSGYGFQVDTASPVWGWKDLVAQIIPDSSGANKPTMLPVRGTGTHIKQYAFSAGDVIDNANFHWTHDYVEGSDIFAHVHWEHAGTAISGNLVLTWYFTWCKGYNQAGQIFEAEKTVTQTISTPNVATYPQYGHFIEEFQISNAGGDSTHLDRALLQTDGLFCIGVDVTTIPTITGAPAGSANEPFILTIDIHYQSTQMSTKNRNYPFYT